MSTTIIFLFLLIFALIAGSLVAVICLIIKASGKKKEMHEKNSLILEVNTGRQNVAEHTNSSKDRISDSDIDYLKKIKDLKECGVLSEEEYNTERDKIVKE